LQAYHITWLKRKFLAEIPQIPFENFSIAMLYAIAFGMLEIKIKKDLK